MECVRVALLGPCLGPSCSLGAQPRAAVRTVQAGKARSHPPCCPLARRPHKQPPLPFPASHFPSATLSSAAWQHGMVAPQNPLHLLAASAPHLGVAAPVVGAAELRGSGRGLLSRGWRVARQLQARARGPHKMQTWDGGCAWRAQDAWPLPRSQLGKCLQQRRRGRRSRGRGLRSAAVAAPGAAARVKTVGAVH